MPTFIQDYRRLLKNSADIRIVEPQKGIMPGALLGGAVGFIIAGHINVNTPIALSLVFLGLVLGAVAGFIWKRQSGLNQFYQQHANEYDSRLIDLVRGTTQPVFSKQEEDEVVKEAMNYPEINGSGHSHAYELTLFRMINLDVFRRITEQQESRANQQPQQRFAIYNG